MTQLTIFDVTPTSPTFIVDYFDKDQAQRLGWVRAKNEDDAKYKFMDKDRNIKITNVYLSDRDFDELEALD
jgi:hypothetical protein